MLRLWLFAVSIIFMCAGNHAYSATLTIPVSSGSYDIYVGDIDNNGYQDFYFKAKPLFVLLHGQIATPLLIPRLGLDLMVLRSGNIYASAVSSTLSAAQINEKIQSNLLVLAQKDIDYVVLTSNSLAVQGANYNTNTFAYDALGRVVTMGDTINGDRKYEYDKAGNRSKVSVRVLGNRAPVAVGESITVPYQTTRYLDVLANDSDPDGDPISIKSFTTCGSASPSLSGRGFNIFASYGPSSCSFTYTITDDRGAVSSATVTVTVN